MGVWVGGVLEDTYLGIGCLKIIPQPTDRQSGRTDVFILHRTCMFEVDNVVNLRTNLDKSRPQRRRTGHPESGLFPINWPITSH